MNRREALGKLKKYWLENDGGDYLNSLRQLRREIPQGHRSSHQLDEEIIAVTAAYDDFLAWKDTAWAQRRKRDTEK